MGLNAQRPPLEGSRTQSICQCVFLSHIVLWLGAAHSGAKAWKDCGEVRSVDGLVAADENRWKLKYSLALQVLETLLCVLALFYVHYEITLQLFFLEIYGRALVLFELDGSAFLWHFPQLQLQSENANFMTNCIFCDGTWKDQSYYKMNLTQRRCVQFITPVGM